MQLSAKVLKDFVTRWKEKGLTDEGTDESVRELLDKDIDMEQHVG